MSRNLGQTDCRECPGGHRSIVLDEAPRPITAADCGNYIADYSGLIVAKAHCRMCHALYLAWVDWPNYSRPGSFSLDEANRCVSKGEERFRFVDLSFQDSFNDEPSPLDTPLFEIEIVYRRRPALQGEHNYRQTRAPESDWHTEQLTAWAKRQQEEIEKKLTIEDEPK